MFQSSLAIAQEALDGLVIEQGIQPAGSDVIFSGRGAGFETIDLPANDAEAARFLTQATFGPVNADVAQVRTLGFSAWINQQIALPATLQRPALEQQIAAQVQVDPRNAPFYRAFRMERWFATAVVAPDQLRQRVAFALSQMLVISDVGALDNNPLAIAEYNDNLLRRSFGNYRDLLRDVTYSPAMGAYLTHLRNQKTDWALTGGNLVPGLIAPDENYAREVMQLFSIGLVERNRDFSPILIAGQSVPTYTQDIITFTARALTGMNIGCTGPVTIGGVNIPRNCGNCVGPQCNFVTQLFFSNAPRFAVPGIVTALIHPDGYLPMVCYPRYADTGRSATAANGYAVLPAPFERKRLVSGVVIEPSPVACHTATPAIDQQACIVYCHGQVDTLVNTLFNHPNVAPMVARQLIQRLTTSNPSPGYIDRVARAFEDNSSGVRGDLAATVRAVLLDGEARTTPSANFGKLREPILKLSALWRAFAARPGNSGLWGIAVPERTLIQRPLGAQTVFNFYEPDYRQPGELNDAGLYSPEFQILDESSAILASDEFWRRVYSGYSFTNNTTTAFNIPANAAYLPSETIDALPADNAAMVEALNVRLLNGVMSATMRGKLVALLNGALAGTDKRRKALNTIHLIVLSPEFAVQR